MQADTMISIMSKTYEIQFRVRYCETDAQGYVHHANYLNYFEMGRVEALREKGCRYRDLEDMGFFLVIAEMHCEYKASARFDDLLSLKTTTTTRGRVKIEHSYELYRDQELLAKARSVIACVDRKGKISRIPDLIR